MAFPVDPTKFNLTGRYGPRKSFQLPNGKWTANFHGGDDLAPEIPGAKELCYAIGDGVIESVGTKSDAGRYIVLRRDNGRRSRYCHLDSYAVRAGQRVVDGQAIGRVGTTGNSNGVHLHFEEYPFDLVTRADPRPFYWNEWNPAKPKPGTTPTKPVETAAEREERELMAAKDEIMRHTQEVSNNDRKWFAEQFAIETSRMRREARPEPYFIQKDAAGKEYTLESSPYAALVHPSTGFIMPLQGPENRAGQIASLRANYRLMAFDAVGTGQAEHSFWNGLKDILRGSGQIDRNISEADGIKEAKKIFGIK